MLPPLKEERERWFADAVPTLSSKLQFSVPAVADVIGLIGRTKEPSEIERERDQKKVAQVFLSSCFLSFLSIKVKQRKPTCIGNIDFDGEH